MSIRFDNSHYLRVLQENQNLKDDSLQFKYGDVTYQKFNANYSSDGWLKRKVIALPAALLAGVVKTVYHLALAIIQIPKALFGEAKYMKAQLFNVARDVQEAYGWLTSFFNDSYGQFHIQESQFHKTCYACITTGQRLDMNQQAVIAKTQDASEKANPTSPKTDDLSCFDRHTYNDDQIEAEQVNTTTRSSVGADYYSGNGVPQSFEEAVRCFEIEANQEDPEARYNLGACYYHGQGVDQSYDEAVKYYKLAADCGYCDAQYNLGVCYYYGQGVGQSYDEAVKFYNLAANKESAAAQFALGLCYHKGLGVAKSYKTAVKYYRLAANGESAKAQRKLGECYARGEGVQRSHDEAARWYKLAADQGDVKAHYKLGLCFQNGEGVARSTEQAIKLYTFAASQGHQGAINALAYLKK